MKTLLKRIFILLVFFFLCVRMALGQSEMFVGVDAQIYPAGKQLTFMFAKQLNENYKAACRLGYNRAKRFDYSGLNDDEEGGGFGFSISLARKIHFGENAKTSLALKCDLWDLNINWKNNSVSPSNGSTRILVLQPTVELAYEFRLGKQKKIILSPTIAFGREMNVRTQGREVGQGPILLGGLQLSYLISKQ